ncbi:SecD/SecF family protein translocase subunit [Candidatus Gracilibacteria bacterium]|nr:SecD/SecF family protein translocase subunit [Candidatus Gracilibacteria bacterium]
MKLSRKQIFTILFLLGLFAIFFVGRKFNPETGIRSLIITSDGISHFRKGLDVSGGTKLVYRVSYEKYEEIYKDPQELNAVKKLIENIVIKNIDKRISKLGVSDYKAYVQNLDNQQYIVVEIGGIADLDQAKEIIGKTVELEFRLPNQEEPTESTIKDRETKAYSLLQEVKTNPSKMDKLADGRGAENIFYNHFTGVTLAQLPDIYTKNAKLLSNIQTGEISDILNGEYATIQTQDQDGIVSSSQLKGFSFFRILDKSTLQKSIIGIEDIKQTADQLGLEYQEKYSSEISDINQDNYEYNGKKLIYNIGEIGSGESAYNVKIISVSKPSILGLSKEEVEEIDESTDLLVEKVKKSINKKGSNLLSGTKLVENGRLSQTEITNIINTFDPNNTGDIQTYKRFDTTYIVYITDQKDQLEKLYSVLEVYNVDETKFEDLLKNQIIYDIEDVFIQDRETWKLALTTQSQKVLNGAYFKYANVSSSQVGEPVVLINFDDAGKEIFCEITSENIGNQMAIFIGGNLLTSPTIQSKICGGGAQIDGQFTPQTAKELINSLNDGALPAPLILMQEEKISPTLGESAFSGAMLATLIGIIAIFVFMLFMYGIKKALIALFTIIVFLVILTGFLKLIDYALSLSGIAAIILALGMAVDANVLIFERFREELSEGKSLGSAIELAGSRSWPAIRDGQLSTGLIAFILFSMGINMFKGFGSMMLATMTLTLLVNVPVTKELLKAFYSKKNTK